MHAIGTALADDTVLLNATLGLAFSLPMAEAAQAMRYNEVALALAEKLDSSLAVIVCYNNLADWLIITGDYAGAIALREANLRRCAALDYKLGTVRALLGIGRAHSMLGDVDGAWARPPAGAASCAAHRRCRGRDRQLPEHRHPYARQGICPAPRATTPVPAPSPRRRRQRMLRFRARARPGCRRPGAAPRRLAPHPATPDSIRAAPASPATRIPAIISATAREDEGMMRGAAHAAP